MEFIYASILSVEGWSIDLSPIILSNVDELRGFTSAPGVSLQQNSRTRALLPASSLSLSWHLLEIGSDVSSCLTPLHEPCVHAYKQVLHAYQSSLDQNWWNCLKHLPSGLTSSNTPSHNVPLCSTASADCFHGLTELTFLVSRFSTPPIYIIR